MPSRLSDMQFDEVSFVPRGANQKAHVVLFKMEPDDGGDQGFDYDAMAKAIDEELEKVGTRKCPDCGAKMINRPGMKCPKCGYKLKDNEDSAGKDAEDGEVEKCADDCPYCKGSKGKRKGMSYVAAGNFANMMKDEEICPRFFVEKRDFSADERDKAASSGKAMGDGSFPIENEDDLKNAVRLVGKSKNPTAAKAHIIKRAKALGATNLLPEDWGVSKIQQATDELDTLLSKMTATDAPERSEGMPKEDAPVRPDGIDKLSEEVQSYIQTLEAMGDGDEPVVKDDGEPAGYDLDHLHKSLTIAKELVEKADASRVEAEDRAKKAEEDAKVAKEEVNKSRSSQTERECIAKAEAWTNIPTSAETMGHLLKVFREKAPDEARQLEEILGRTNAVVKTSNVFAELGKSGGFTGDTPGMAANSQVDSLAMDLMQRDSNLTKSQAISKVLNDHPELYQRQTNGPKGVR